MSPIETALANLDRAIRKARAHHADALAHDVNARLRKLEQSPSREESLAELDELKTDTLGRRGRHGVAS